MSTLSLDTDLTLNYEVSGGNGSALLLFNGATLPLTFWGSLADRLSENFRVVRFDQRNAGETRFEGSFSLLDCSADAANLLNHLGIDTACVVGHAWGGRAAQVFARDYPHRVAGLVICGTGGRFPPGDLGTWPQRLRAARRAGDREAWEVALEAMFCGSDFRLRSPDTFRSIADACWQPPLARGRWDSRIAPSESYWGAARCPSLLIYGGQDRNGTPENARDLQSRLGGELHMFDDAGHFVVREREAETARLITHFAGSMS